MAHVAKAGILTWHYYANVGSNLQAYAMQRLLERSGVDASFINYRHRDLDGDRGLKSVVKDASNVLQHVVPCLPRFETHRFQKKRFRQTPRVYQPEEARDWCNQFDAVICGSDQIWAPNVFDPVYFLEDVSDRVTKIAYAASIGLPRIPDELRERYRTLLSQFDAIGIREEQGCELLRGMGIEASTVLDPTFLIPADEWLRLSTTVRTRVCKGCIFCYFLGNSKRYAKAVRKAAKKTGLPVVAYLPEGGEAPVPDCDVIRRLSVPEFLSWMNASSLVMTDSFHGIALSINLRKDFCAYKRFDEDDEISQNSRVVNILSKVGLLDRLFALDDANLSPIDWDAVGKRLDGERLASRTFLDDALKDCDNA